MFIPVKKPWTSQPPYVVPAFDPANAFGANCIGAIIPGWFGAESIRSVGQPFRFDRSDGGTPDEAAVKAFNYPKIGSAKALYLDHGAATNAVARLINTDGTGFEFLDKSKVSVVALVRPTGDGRGGQTIDPRIYSKDTGTAEADHDLMVGIANSCDHRYDNYLPFDFTCNYVL